MINSQDIEEKTGIKRNTMYDLEEIKVRWKKAALENCPGVPCVVTPPAPSFTCGTSTISDVSGYTYNTVLIGTQCWTKENLKVTKYNDGTDIPDLTNSISNPWAPTSGARTGYVGSGVPSSGYVGTYGYLYNWYAVNDSRKLCPTGWHVPTDGEWTSLVRFIDPAASAVGIQSLTAGGKMKSTSTLWTTATPPSAGTDDYGFSALPGGFRNRDGNFYNISINAIFWSANVRTTTEAWYRHLFNDNGNVTRYPNALDMSYGASVRCLRD